MDRRTFLRRLVTGVAGAAIGAELDLERLLWVPKPIITVPGCYVPIDWIAREMLTRLEHNLTFAKAINRAYDDALVGQTVNIRLARRFA